MHTDFQHSEFSNKQLSKHAGSSTSLWIGRVLTALPLLFLAVDGLLKLIGFAPYVEGTIRLGFPVNSMLGMATAELVCVVLCAIPRTSFVGTIMLTGFLGGATAAHVRIGDPFFSHVLFPAYVATCAWAGLTLRDRRLQTLLLTPAR